MYNSIRQIFLVDNIDLGIFNIPHNVVPRIQLFDGVRLKRMILMCCHKINGENLFIAPPVSCITIYRKQ